MDYKDARQYVLAGFFAVFGLVIIMGVIWALGKEKGLTQPKFQVQVLYRSVGGLIQGAPIRLGGVNVGSVGNIEFLQREIMGRRVKVTLNIFQKYQGFLDSSAKFYIMSEGVLGEKLVEIVVSGGGAPLTTERPLIGEDPLEIQELASAFAGAANSFKKTAEDLNQDLSQIDIKALADVFAEAAQSMTHTAQEVDQLILDLRAAVNDTNSAVQPLLEELSDTTRRSKKVLDRVEQKLIDGNLFKVF